jgi:hypothetical protein
LFKAGFSKVCISPSVGSPLAGFAARKSVSEGVHDDLFAHALVMENSETAIALVSVDVLALSGGFVRRVRAGVAERTGINPDAVMIACTHTHAGPVTITTFFNPGESLDPSYMDRLASAIIDAVTNAWQSRFPARVGVGVGHVRGVGVNRRTPDQRPVDEEIGIIKVEDADGRTRAVLMNYACHPTVLGPDNRLITGDFPAFAVKEIEESIGSDGLAMFVNGTQGNISMGHSSELSAIGVITPGRTFERAAELGHLLSQSTLDVLGSIQTSDAAVINAVTVSIGLPIKKYPAVEETSRQLRAAEEYLTDLAKTEDANTTELRRAKSEHLYASITNFYAKETQSLNDGLLHIELQGIRIDDAVFVAVPAEVFVEIGLRLKKMAPYKTFIVGLANDYIGYLPTSEAHEAGGYEVVSSKCRPEAADVLVEKIIKIEHRLHGDASAL